MIRLFKGTTGDDRLLGSSGIDYIYADAGNDVLFGYVGTDFLRGSFGNDSLDGGQGNDFLESGEDNDNLVGGYGRDILLGQSGNDVLNGGGDNDTVSGGLGADQLTGGSGADKFVFIAVKDSTPTARDLITDFSLTSGDVIDLSSIKVTGPLAFNSGDPFTAVNQVRATALPTGRTLVEVNTSGVSGAEMAFEINHSGTLLPQHFKLTGGTTTDDSAHSVKLGTTGPDTLNGGGGEDYVYGNAGNDTLRGGGDSDLMRAGEGNDRVDGGAGDDGLYGGEGADVFIVSGGSDLLQDFEPGIDRIEVASATINSFEQLAITPDIGGALVTVAGVGSIFVADAAPTSVTAADFVFT